MQSRSVCLPVWPASSAFSAAVVRQAAENERVLLLRTARPEGVERPRAGGPQPGRGAGRLAQAHIESGRRVAAGPRQWRRACRARAHPGAPAGDRAGDGESGAQGPDRWCQGPAAGVGRPGLVSRTAWRRHSRVTTTKNAVRVFIGGEEYTVRSEVPPEYTREVTAYLDAALKRVRDSLPMVESHKAAILAGLAITDELFQSRRGDRELADRISAMADDLARLLPPAKRGNRAAS